MVAAEKITADAEIERRALAAAGQRIHTVRGWVQAYRYACRLGDADTAERFRRALHALGKAGVWTDPDAADPSGPEPEH